MLNIGIIGTGNIAHTMAKTAAALPDVRIAAAGSRSAEKARAFADEFGGGIIPFASYEDLCRSEAVDLVYVATPHGRHFEDARLALECGKHVLCEKAFTLNAAQASELKTLAESRGLFLCEAMWPRFNPVIKQVRAWVEGNYIGAVKFAEAEAGFRGTYDTGSRLYNEESGGGAVLDMGVYPLAFVSLVFGGAKPELMAASAAKYPNGVDKYITAMLKYGGAHAVITASVSDRIPTRANIFGEEGFIEVTGSFVNARQAKLHRYGFGDCEFSCEISSTGYEYELTAVAGAINSGMTGCVEMTMDETVTIMRTVDCIKDAIGLKYTKE